MYVTLVETFTHFFVAFRIEWSKARARSERWKEEVLLLREEMRRTLVSLQFFLDMWSARACPSSLLSLSRDPAISEGISAYAHHQSHVFASLHHRCQLIWNGLEKAGVSALATLTEMPK